MFQAVFNLLKIRCAKYRPLGSNKQGIGTLQHFVLILAIGYVIAIARLYIVHSLGVESLYPGTGSQQLVNIIQGRGLPDVIGIGFEGQPPQSDGFALQVIVEVFLHFFQQAGFLSGINVHHGIQNAEVIGHFGSRLRQRLHVFRKATTTIADTRKEKALAYARVGTDTFAHHIHIGSQAVAQVGNFIHKSDFGSQKGVGGIFGQLGRALVHIDDRVALAHQRGVEFIHYLFGLFRSSADNHPVGFHEVIHGHPLAQKLWVGHHIKGHLGAGRNGSAHFLSSAHRHGALINNYGVIGKQGRQVFGYAQDILQIGRPVFTRRGRQRQKNHLGIADAFGQRGGEIQPPLAGVALKKNLQTGLINRHAALIEHLDFVFINIYTGYVVARFGKAGAGYQPYISGANYSYFH